MVPPRSRKTGETWGTLLISWTRHSGSSQKRATPGLSPSLTASNLGGDPPV